MLKIMLVDDEELAIKRLSRILSESGVPGSVHSFLNPQEAYAFARNNPIDLAFLDISMPEIHGMKLSELLHGIDESMEIAFVTGYDGYALQAFETDAFDYLLKPVTTERVAKTLAKFHRRKGRQADKPELTVRIFGGLHIFRNEKDQSQKPLKLRSPKTEELFAFLICQGTVSRDETIDMLWEGLETEKAWKNLNSNLYYIRKAFGEAGIRNWIIADRNEIRIEKNNLFCDLYEFEEVVKQIRLNTVENAEGLYQRAESLYAGPLLKGKAYEWAAGKAGQLEHRYTEVLEQAANHHLAWHRMQEALHYFNEILKIDGFREDIVYEIISIALGMGRINEAVRYYKRLEKLLEEELGVEPGPRLKSLIKAAMDPS